MKTIKFTKMVAAGNDFIVLRRDYSLSAKDYSLLAKRLCERKYGIGADGLLVSEKSKTADFKMRIFNPDGSEADMCGNGARCIALFSSKKSCSFETGAGIIEASVCGNIVKLKMPEPKGLKLNLNAKISGRNYKLDFINTGVPHAVNFVSGVCDVDVKNIGARIRYHSAFKPAGANVNFVKILNSKNIQVRTYERGVEDETQACGTGSTASAILSSFKAKANDGRKAVNVMTASGDSLRVYFKKIGNTISEVYLQGCAHIIFEGGINV